MENERAEMSEKSTKILTNSRVLDKFRKLGDVNFQIRLKTGLFLVKSLGTIDTEEKKVELRYTLNRIVRCLGSSNESARSGYFTVLVALLTIHQLPFDELESAIEKELKISKSCAKGEIGDICLGQILTYGATIRSGVYFKYTKPEQRLIVENLFDRGKRKQYLIVAVVTFLEDLIKKADENEFTKSFWPVLQPEIVKEWPQQNLNYISLLLLVKQRFPKVLDKKLLKKQLGHADILSSYCIKPLCDILLDIPTEKSLRNPAYAIISQEIAKSDFVIEFVNEFDQKIQNPSRNKFIVSSMIFTNIILNVKDFSQLPLVIPSNFLTCLVQTCKELGNKHNDREIANVVNNFFDAIAITVRTVGVTDETKLKILKRLLLSPGDFFIEKNTKVKIIQQITTTMSVDGVKTLSGFYRDISAGKFDEMEGKKGWYNMERVYASQLLAKLLAHPNVRNEIGWKIEQIKFICRLAFIKDEETANIGVDLVSSFQETFYHCLDMKFSKLEHLRSALSVIVHYLNSFISSENCAELFRVSLSTEVLELWQKTIKLIDKLEKKSSDKPIVIVFHTLFLHIVLHLFNESKLAMTSLEDLFECYKKSKEEKRKSKQIQTENDEDKPEINWIEVVVDLFLNLLSQNSVLLRKLICCVFPHLCKHLTPSAIHQILAVVDPKNEKDPLSNPNDSESSDDEDEDTPEKEDDSEEESDAFEEEDELLENETMADKLRTAVREALGGDAGLTDNESIDLDEIDDDKGAEIDGALSEAFRQFRSSSGRKSRKLDKNAESLLHFRLRVLDLIEIYLNSEPSMLTCLEIMIPLLNALEFSAPDHKQKPLYDRLNTIFKIFTSLKKFSSIEGINNEVLTNIMASLLSKGSKSVIVAKEMSEQITWCCLFIIRCSKIYGESEETPKKMKKKLKKEIIKILVEALDSFFRKKNCVTSFFMFKCILSKSWDGILALVTKLHELIFDPEIKLFQKSEALEMLSVFYRNHRYLISEKAEVESSLNDVLQNFSQDIIQLLQNVIENTEEKGLSRKFISNLLTVFLLLKNGPIKIDQFNWQGIADVLGEYRECASFSRDGKALYKRLSEYLGIKKINGLKKPIKKLEEGGNESRVSEKREKVSSKHKNNNSKAKKLKKETQLQRLQTNSEGLTDFHFSRTNVGVNGFESGEENDESKENGMEVDSNNKKRKHLSDTKKSKKLKKNVTE